MFKELGRNNRLVMLSLFIWALGEGLWYINLRQLYLVELGATEVQVGLALALEATLRGLLLIPAGYVVDRVGAQRVMIASWVLGIGGPLIGALARSWQMFIPGLAVYAMSAFAIPSISVYALQNVADPGSPGVADRVLTAIFAIYPAGLIVSPFIGGLIADALGIRACLWISTVIFTISTLIILLTSHVDAHHPRHEEERPRDLLRNTAFLHLIGYYAFVSVALLVGYQLAPNFLQEVRGFSYAQIGLLFSVSSAGTVILNLLAGRTSPRWNFAAALVVVWLALLGIWRVEALSGLVAAFFGAGAIQVVRVLAMARVAGVVPGRHQGLAFGIAELVLSISMAVAAGAAGRLYTLTPSHDLPLIVAAAAIPVAFGLWFVIRNRLPLAAERTEPATATGPAD